MAGRGRPRKNTMQVSFRINCDYIEKLKAIKPSLTTIDVRTQEVKFRHGALGRYLERLVAQDLERQTTRPTLTEMFGDD